MLPQSLLLFLLFIIIPTSMSYAVNENGFFCDDGFNYTMIRVDGVASFTSGRVLMLTNGDPQQSGHAFYWGNEFNSIFSFSTTFVFLISSAYDGLSEHGLAFTLSSTINFVIDALPSQYLGLLNDKNNGNATKHLFAVELDTIQSTEFLDIDKNHVGIDINSLKSINSHTAGYYTSNGTFSPLRLASGEPMQVWVDYDGNTLNLNVSLAPYLEPKPQRPLLSSSVNLTSVLGTYTFYAGFSSSTGTVNSKHYIIGWSFSTTGEAQPLNYSGMSRVIEDVRQKTDVAQEQNRSHIPSSILLPTVIPSAFMALVILVVLYVLRKKARKNGEWEIECGPPTFTYKDLATATRGFSDRMVLGKGGFGKVYKGVLQTSKQNVAIKRVSPDSKQGMKEFIAEITILGHLRHRNLIHHLRT